MHNYELRDKFPANLTHEFHHDTLALSLLNLVPAYSKVFHRGSICALETATHRFFLMTPLFLVNVFFHNHEINYKEH